MFANRVFLNSSEDGVYKSQSKITRAALFWNFTSLSFNVELQLPPDNTK